MTLAYPVPMEILDLATLTWSNGPPMLDNVVSGSAEVYKENLYVIGNYDPYGVRK